MIDYYDQLGRRHWETVGPSKKGAVERLAQRLLEIRQGPCDPRLANTRLKEYARKWLETYVRPNLKPSTLKAYSECLENHILPFLGDSALKSVRRDMVIGFLAGLSRKGLSRSSVSLVYAVLRAILSSAVDAGILAANPVVRMGRFTQRRAEPQRTFNPMSREEISLFLETARIEALAYYPLFLCLARTGLRIGEAIALKCGDLDFAGFGIEVRRSIVQGRAGTPKNGRTRRVDMSQQLAQVLRGEIAKHKAQLLRLGKSADQLGDVWVFQNGEGNPLDDSKIRKVLARVLTKAGLHRRNLHSLRHSFASLLIQNGESLAYVKDQLGHHSIQLTVDTYGHLAPGGNREAVDRLDDDRWRAYPRLLPANYYLSTP